MRRAFQTIGLTLFGVVASFLLAEGTTRLVRPLSTVEYRVDPEIGQILVANQQARWVGQDYDVSVSTNSAGFHDVEHRIGKPSGVYRIVVLGDSFIEGLAIPIERGFTQQLEFLLQRQVEQKRVEVINLGVSGIGPAQYLRMLERRGLTYEPDLVLMAIYPENDFWDSYDQLSGAPSKAFYKIEGDDTLRYIPPDASRLAVSIRPFLRKSAFLNFMRHGISFTSLERNLGKIGLLQAPGISVDHSMDWGVYDDSLPAPWPEAYRTTLRVIAVANQLARQHQAEFLAMTIGSVAMVEDRWAELFADHPAVPSMKWQVLRPFSVLADLGREHGFEVIDLAQPFRHNFLATGRSRSWPHDGHWNEEGHRVAAEIIVQHLLANQPRYRL
jgi:hypothetical protein